VSVRPSEVGTVPKRLNEESRKQYCTIAQGFLFSGAKNIGEIRKEVTPTTAPNKGGIGSVGDFRPVSRYISETVQDRDKCIM